MSILSERLINARKEKNWSRKQAASVLKIPYQTYSNYEIGKRKPDADMINRLAEKFDISADYLVGITSNPRQRNTKVKPSDQAEEDMLVAFRKQTEGMSENDKQKFQRSLDKLMNAAKDLSDFGK